MRSVPLTSIAGGINRQRIKGNAAPNALYDLVNAFVTQAGTILPREGTYREAALDDTTVGLVAFKGIFNVFSTDVEDVPSGYACNVLVNPADSADTLDLIWYAQPFMGFLYVVAQFASGDVVHYWLQSSGEWAANTVYQAGQIVVPDVANGLAYQATRTSSVNPTWAPNTATSLGAKVEPSVPNGYYFTATYVAGTNPTTGTTEPTWPTTIGGVVDDFGNFQVNQLSTSSTPTAALSSTITNIYGDTQITAGGAVSTSGPTMGGLSYTNASSTSTATGGTVAPIGQVSTWAGGTLYLPGALVIPSTTQGAVTGAIPNGDFEDGDDGSWTKSGNWKIGAVGVPFQGSYQAYNSPAVVVNGELTQAVPIAVVPGKTITATCMGNNGTNNAAAFDVVLELVWYNASTLEISATQSAPLGATGNHWKQMTVTGTAPAGAAFVAVRLLANSGTSSRDTCGIDTISWDYVAASTATGLIYQNVATSPGTSGATEPTWPDTPGDEVTDGGVIWEAVGASVITWTAFPIQYSGASEPTFPTTVGATVFDGQSATDPGAFAWTAIARNITDVNCPNTISVVTGASKIFAIDEDVVRFCATTNPTDWTSQNDAGYLPTGLQQYGSNPAAVLGLYRGNLMVFNGGGYQMWQIDPDPANMAILDAQPVGSVFTRAYQSVANDGILLTPVGIRNVGTTGASANMQTGTTGQPIDVLVQAELTAGTYTPISLYYPARGQYWLIFGPTAYVLTVNGNNQRSWSRYVFPDTITDWTLNGAVLYLRSVGNLVWKVDATALQDDVYTIPGTMTVNMTAGAGSLGLTNFSIVAGGSYGLFDTAGYSDGQNGMQGTRGSLASGGGTGGLVLDGFYYSIANTVSPPQTGTLFLFAHTTGYTGSGPPQNVFTSISFTDGTGFVQTLDSAAASFTAQSNGGHVPAYWSWVLYTGTTAAEAIVPTDTYAVTVVGGNEVPVGYDDGVTDSATPYGSMDSTSLGSVGTLNAFSADWSSGNDNFITLIVTGASSAPTQSDITSVAYTGIRGAETLDTTDATYSTSGSTATWVWVDEPSGSVSPDFSNGDVYAVVVTSPLYPAVPEGIDFTGVIWWPWLDMGALGLNKEVIGFDLVGTGAVNVAIGYDQSDLSAFTPNFLLEAADTVYGQPTPLPVSGPSFSLYLEFSANQAWSWEAANLYVNDTRSTG